jgi:hypothetical protein
MEGAGIYFTLGLQHITDLGGYDHMLFLLALCAVYRLAEWRQVVWIVSAFTIGHCLSLALSSFTSPILPTDVIEFLIPITILATCAWNVLGGTQAPSTRKQGFAYGVAVLFGLIHGMGFSNYLRALIGQEQSLFAPLLCFNIGLELGQLLIVGLLLGLSFLFLDLLKVPRREWTLFLSGLASGISLILASENRFW